MRVYHIFTPNRIYETPYWAVSELVAFWVGLISLLRFKPYRVRVVSFTKTDEEAT